MQQPRRDSVYEPHVRDPYIERGKWSEPTVCPDCGAIFQQGRWQWGAATPGAESHRCPACSRIHDRVPAGMLTLSGAFFQAHRDEIINLIRNHEAQEKAEHPLERIMAIEDGTDDAEGETVITFTGRHLTLGTGSAIHKAYEGDFDYQFTDRDAMLRARWQR